MNCYKRAKGLAEWLKTLGFVFHRVRRAAATVRTNMTWNARHTEAHGILHKRPRPLLSAHCHLHGWIPLTPKTLVLSGDLGLLRKSMLRAATVL